MMYRLIEANSKPKFMQKLSDLKYRYDFEVLFMDSVREVDHNYLWALIHVKSKKVIVKKGTKSEIVTNDDGVKEVDVSVSEDFRSEEYINSLM